jgi:hypothetical protein
MSSVAMAGHGYGHRHKGSRTEVIISYENGRDCDRHDYYRDDRDCDRYAYRDNRRYDDYRDLREEREREMRYREDQCRRERYEHRRHHHNDGAKVAGTILGAAGLILLATH